MTIRHEPQPPTNVWAAISLTSTVLGWVTLFLIGITGDYVTVLVGVTFFVCGFVFAICGVVAGILAFKQIQISAGAQVGNRLATAGVVLGILNLIAWLALTVYMGASSLIPPLLYSFDSP